MAAYGELSMATVIRYTRCIRNQGVSDFPDPPPSQAAPSGFKSIRACEARPQQPDVQDCHPDVPLIGTRREAATPPAGANITEELRWARCTRSHGVPSFPDPNRQRAFDSSSKFDPHPRFRPPARPANRRADRACSRCAGTGTKCALAGRPSTKSRRTSSTAHRGSACRHCSQTVPKPQFAGGILPGDRDLPPSLARAAPQISSLG